MIHHEKDNGVRKLPTGIPGFDLVSHGGVPESRTTLVAGTAGSAKTVIAVQFLAEGIRQFHEHGVFVTCEESPAAIIENMRGFGWDIATWQSESKWAFVDASPQPDQDAAVSGRFDLGALLARIEHAVRKVGATRISLDSLGALFSQLPDAATVRRELLRVAVALKRMKVTALMTVERTEEFGDISRFGVEEFVADNVIVLRNVLEEEKRRRTLEILKYRGTAHQRGEFAFTIIPRDGVVVIPLSAIELKQKSSNLRVSSGIRALDEMCGGGFFRDSVILVSGATGTGKTLTVTEFLAGGARNGERCLLFAFEESREQLFRNATGWGHDFEAYERQDKLRVVCEYPEIASLEDHLIRFKDIVEKFRPNRVAIDSLSALERVATIKSFREFVIALTSFVKHKEIAAMFTCTTPTLTGGASITETHISTLTDSILLLRYVEMFGEMRRGLTVLKMRGSIHDKQIREFTIASDGMHIGRPFRNVVGILAGNPVHVTDNELDRLGRMFEEPS